MTRKSALLADPHSTCPFADAALYLDTQASLRKAGRRLLSAIIAILGTVTRTLRLPIAPLCPLKNPPECLKISEISY